MLKIKPAAGWLLLPGFLCLAVVSATATTLEHGPSPEVKEENQAALIEIARLRIHNIKDGVIEGSSDRGEKWMTVGRVLQPTNKVNPRGYNASRYAPAGTVAATAVNAIHLKSGHNEKENRGIIWSLAPAADTPDARTSLQSEVSPGSAVFTDIPGGSGIFGGPYTPFVGNPILLDNDRDNQPVALPEKYVPVLGDSWIILIMRPRLYPREIVFENRFGGLITIDYHEYPPQPPQVIGQVLRPVQGVGRFVGSYFSEVGRLRANHNGVIDISTSPRGKVGSFQIVPANHAMSPETHYIREKTQWMVVGPVSALDPSWEGTAPLYSAYLRPRYDTSDWFMFDALEGVLGRFAFEVKWRGKTGWQPMPEFALDAAKPLPSWADTALSGMTHLRIVFPVVLDGRRDQAAPTAATPPEAQP